jgi:predicted RNA-binding protein (virulence factor B family)
MIDFRDNISNFGSAEQREKLKELNKLVELTNYRVYKMGANVTENEKEMVTVDDPQAATSILTGSRLEQRISDLNRQFRIKRNHLTAPTNKASVPEAELREMYQLQGQRTGAGGQERRLGGE